jgi:hypothetical protein
MNKWRVFEKEKPPVGAYVLAYFDGDMEVLKMEVEAFEVDDRDKPLFLGDGDVPDVMKGNYWVNSSGEELEGVEVTHWTPLPMIPYGYNTEEYPKEVLIKGKYPYEEKK